MSKPQIAKCPECGKEVRHLSRHLKTMHDASHPSRQARAKYTLPNRVIPEGAEWPRISGAQARMARSALNMTLRKMAKESGVSVSTLLAFEMEKYQIGQMCLYPIVMVFVNAGITFQLQTTVILPDNLIRIKRFVRRPVGKAKRHAKEKQQAEESIAPSSGASPSENPS